MIEHCLSWMTFFPLLPAAIIVFLPSRFKDSFKWLAFIGALVPFVLSIYVFAQFDRNLVPKILTLKTSAPSLDHSLYGLQFVERAVWIRTFNIEYFVGIDGLSAPMVLLTALVSFVAVIASMLVKKPVEPHHNSLAGIQVKERAYYSLLLLLETGMMGVFVALDFFLFYIFWELMLLPMYFLIGIWGGPRKEYAAIKFFLYTLLGSVLMLLAIIYMYIYGKPTQGNFLLADGSVASHTFNMMYLAYHTQYQWVSFISPKLLWVFFFIGFAIKIPMFPFHTWLPDAHVEAPTPISVILAGVLLKMGTYGILRINFPMFPAETLWASTAVAVFGTINIVYGALCAMSQKDFKSLVAYSSISHMGFCLLGMSSFTQEGMNGAVLQMFNHGTITSMMFILVGVIYDRAHHRDLNGFGGLAKVLPVYTGFSGLAFMAALGLPGLSGFIGEALVFLGAFQTHRIATIISASGVILAACYVLWTIHRVFLGPLKNEDYAHYSDLNFREWASLVPLAIPVIVLGFYPMPVLDLMSATLGALKDFVLMAR
jgi:NADH-quinone oxidoreductase subunit M